MSWVHVVHGQTQNNLAELALEHKQLRRSLSMEEMNAVAPPCQLKLSMQFAPQRMILSGAQVRIISADIYHHVVNKFART